jgi:hypothetical protein
MTLSVQYGATVPVSSALITCASRRGQSAVIAENPDGRWRQCQYHGLSKTMSDYADLCNENQLTERTVNGQTAAITTNAQAVADINGNLNAMYSIKSAWM